VKSLLESKKAKHMLREGYMGTGVTAKDRYCRNCGQELQPEDRFCGNCGRPVHATAHVPTLEADVSVPPPLQRAEARSVPPQAPQASSGEGRVRTVPIGPMLGMLAVFLVLGIGETIQGIPATSTKDLGFRIGVGMGGAIAASLVTAAIILLVGVIYYAFENKQGQGVTFRGAICNWPLVIVAGFLTFSNLL